MTKEQVYDEQINPLMTQIIEICKKHKINAHASFFLEGLDNTVCTTHLKLDGDPLVLELLYLAAYCRQNIDLMYIKLAQDIKSGRFKDGGSVLMSILEKRDV